MYVCVCCEIDIDVVLWLTHRSDSIHSLEYFGFKKSCMFGSGANDQPRVFLHSVKVMHGFMNRRKSNAKILPADQKKMYVHENKRECMLYI